MSQISPKAKHYLDAVREIAPQLELIAEETEQTGDFPRAAFDLMNERGLLKMVIPPQWGGAGMTAVEYFPVLTEVAKISGALRMLVHGHNGVWRMIDRFGTAEQRQHWLPQQATGSIFAFGFTEPGGTGRGLQTTATRDGDDWIINGEKHLITFADQADMIHVIAATGRDQQGAVASVFLVPKDTPGQIITPMKPTMGCVGVEHCHVSYDNVRVPHSSILGTEGVGLEIALECMLPISRVSIGYSALGLAKRAFELAVDFAKNRVTLGQPIANRQSIRESLAEMAADIYTVQTALDDASARFDAGELIMAEAAITKLQALEMVGRVTDKALRIHGGIGYTSQYQIERHYRDARALWFEEGTAEIQKFVIADQVLNHGFNF